MSENVDESLEQKIQEHQEDFDKKILDLFIGNAYYDSDLVNPVLDYGRITVTPSSNTSTELNNTDSSVPEETKEETQTSVNQQMHESSQKTVTKLTKLTKAILGNPKAMKRISDILLPNNVQNNSLAKYLQDATTDKNKQKTLVKALKLYVRDPK